MYTSSDYAGEQEHLTMCESASRVLLEDSDVIIACKHIQYLEESSDCISIRVHTWHFNDKKCKMHTMQFACNENSMKSNIRRHHSSQKYCDVHVHMYMN